MKKLITVFFLLISILEAQTASVININHIYLPFNNEGILADVNYGSSGAFGRYDDNVFLFSGGFALTGFADSLLWGNAVLSSSLILDYQSGLIGGDPTDEKNIIYSISKDDPPFGDAWQKWTDAVELGADFYDGNGNGYYDPIDHNNNSEWDNNEDRPGLLYDETYFTVYNDGVQSEKRRWNTIEPLGIEIRQTIFASNRNEELATAVFIKYSILYKGLGETTDLDSLTDVIFSIWTDTDIGLYSHEDDTGGSDTTLQSGYTYNFDKVDEEWGVNPPAVFKVFVQGPLVKSNPNDKGYNKKGPHMGLIEYPGYRNSKLGAYVNIYSGDIMPISNSVETVRNYMFGLKSNGVEVDPCNFFYGDVFGEIRCEDVNAQYWFNGFPEDNYGWISTSGGDCFDQTSSEKFTLVKNEPMDIIVAYVVGRGSDNLNSITRAREITQYVHEEYQRNFSTLASVENNNEDLPTQFYLSQNYPNPFNPATKIKYTIGVVDENFRPLQTQLIVYDILGRKVKTLVNEVKSPGTYEITFDASQLASGVYFYRLTSGNLVQTKKMILLR
ncbi:hypothetical protein ASZ90_005063 [hydrocarbon metagenome]|uniref:Secretion system C-terminal sorting domain-containing protein n=1 Tax=hydrocarbon metagenome TaxID=938273 RepID=A0A0W8FW37_9ZZZZ